MAENRNLNNILCAGMRAACAEGRRWLGATSPNPPVGASALNANGDILAATAHQRAGTDHAEAALLKLCRERDLLNQIDSLCITLEPCNHQGRTPPCTEAILQAGIKRVAIGMRDPNPHVKGGGAEHLRAAGIEVVENVESDLCERLMHAFAFHARAGRPFVTVKRAFDRAGSMIPPPGLKTFTTQESLILAHRLRKKADAIVTGSGTIIADNPSFIVRHVPDHGGRRRILAILDRRKRVSAAYIDAATGRGFTVQLFDDLEDCFLTLTTQGMQDILVESGPILSKSILDSPLWSLQVDIHASLQSDLPDRIDSALNPVKQWPFDIEDLSLDSLLPT
jgi:diaminohydroxyphosphoribosylaminopyrimidine deaminase/5-amino-6-(5-phosphoribosylamino)uracil reductase